jgi:hypothetical protein
MLYLMHHRLFDNLHAQHAILYNSSRRHPSQSLMLQEDEERKKRQLHIIFWDLGQ